jgi:hypothetical protein
MNKLIIIVGAVVFSTSSLLAQEAVEADKLIQYDPLFWKDQLKLDNDQCLKIREINGEYYQNLFTAYQEEKDNRDALQRIAYRSLIQRNIEIWETFDSKQRKRWRRISQETIDDNSRNQS